MLENVFTLWKCVARPARSNTIGPQLSEASDLRDIARDLRISSNNGISPHGALGCPTVGKSRQKPALGITVETWSRETAPKPFMKCRDTMNERACNSFGIVC